MSITRMLTRMAAVAALRGSTWADDRVFDSDNTPLSQALTLNAAAKPYIVVYTDSDSRMDQNGTDLYGMTRELNLVLEIGVASKVEGTTGEETIKTPLTDEGMEIALDMVEDQALAALFGDAQSGWAELLKSLVLRVQRVSGQRGASADRDRRWAARQLSIVCDVVSDLPPGVAVPHDHPIQLFVRTSNDYPDAGMQPISDICNAIIGAKPSPKWEQMQAMFGVRRIGLRAAGLAPLSAGPLSRFATMHGPDLTDKRGEAPILRKIGADDFDWVPDPEIGLTEEKTISTNVGTIEPKEPKDKVEMGE